MDGWVKGVEGEGEGGRTRELFAVGGWGHGEGVCFAEAVEGPVGVVELSRERFRGVVGEDGDVFAGAGGEGPD